MSETIMVPIRKAKGQMLTPEQEAYLLQLLWAVSIHDEGLAIEILQELFTFCPLVRKIWNRYCYAGLLETKPLDFPEWAT